MRLSWMARGVEMVGNLFSITGYLMVVLTFVRWKGKIPLSFSIKSDKGFPGLIPLWFASSIVCALLWMRFSNTIETRIVLWDKNVVALMADKVTILFSLISCWNNPISYLDWFLFLLLYWWVIVIIAFLYLRLHFTNYIHILAVTLVWTFATRSHAM